MKKIVSLLLVLMLIFMVGCAQEPAMEEPAMEEPAMEEPAMEDPAMEDPAMEDPGMVKEYSFGVGFTEVGRIGPGVDDHGVQVYSFNTVAAAVVFDQEGKIADIFLDQLEVATPNYDGEGMPHFAGWPGQEYNYDADHNESAETTLTFTDESFVEEVATNWITKRERGDVYQMGVGAWYSHADTYQDVFRGKTVAEIEEWVAMYCSDESGKPLKLDEESSEGDVAKFEALSDDDKAMLADVTSMASISLTDEHGDIVGAIKDAEMRAEPVVAEFDSIGLGFDSVGRIGPGVDDTGTQVYSFNVVYAGVLFNADTVTDVYLDQLEVATPNYDGEGMPHMPGWPGQEYNYDADHNESAETTLVFDDDAFLEEIATNWNTKRERGDLYQMGVGAWYSHANTYQEIFKGKTIAEIEEWVAMYCSDESGKPLKLDEESSEGDVVKFEALSDDDRAMLADVTSMASISLTDEHGNIIGALKAAFGNKVAFK